ncbi:hypothetical protein B0H11DRAFT_2184851 [Mycena galericulata]|nr:hypothetical protein B0H11DRAFT_2184851 [Mycena galericulata]
MIAVRPLSPKGLNSHWEDDPENPRNWSTGRKWISAGVVSLYTFIAPLSSNIMAPCLPEVATKYGIKSETIEAMTLSIFLVSFAIGPLFLAPLSELYGRRWHAEEASSVTSFLSGIVRPAWQFTAQLLHDRGIYLSKAGRHEDALRAEEEAVDLRHKLVAMEPSVSENLAESLHNLAIDLSAVGRHEDALRAAEEAVHLRRKLAETDPAVRTELARSLHNVGLQYHSLGRDEDALRRVSEAVNLFRQLAEKDTTVANDLSRSLHNLGLKFSSVGLYEDALHVDEETVKLRRKLAEMDPTASSDLAQSLHNLGVDLREMGRYEDGLRAGEEAIELYRKLAETDLTLTRYLAYSLENLGFILSAVGRPEDAVRVEHEAIELHEKLPEPSVASELELGTALRCVAAFIRALGGGGIFAVVGLHEDALHAEEAAVELYKSGLRSLEGLVGNLRVLGREDDAVHIDAQVAFRKGRFRPIDRAVWSPRMSPLQEVREEIGGVEEVDYEILTQTDSMYE